MKKLITLLLALFMVSAVFSAELKEKAEYEKEFDSTQSIKIARLWVSENFKSGKNVIDTYDEELQILVGNGSCTEKVKLLNMQFHFKFKITVKENKVKIVFSNFKVGEKHNELQKGTVGVDQFYKTLDKLAESLFQYYEDF